MIREEKLTRYTLICDRCGTMFHGFTYESYGDLCQEAIDAGWCAHPQDENFGEAEYHFCGEKCRTAFLCEQH